MRDKYLCEQGIKARYLLNEGAGNTVKDTINGYDLTITGAIWEKTERGMALKFDGVDDYAVCNGTINILPRNLTVVSTVKILGATVIGAGSFIGVADTTTTNANATFYVNPANVAIRSGANSSSSTESHLTEWLTVVGVFYASGTGDKNNVFTNGQLDATLTDSTNFTISKIAIGGTDTSPHFTSNGLINYVAVYQREFTTRDIQARYAQFRLPGKATKLKKAKI